MNEDADVLERLAELLRRVTELERLMRARARERVSAEDRRAASVYDGIAWQLRLHRTAIEGLSVP